MLKSKFKRITISGKTKIVSKIDHLKILRNEWLLAYGIANGRKISVSHFLILITSSLSLQLFYIYVCVCFSLMPVSLFFFLFYWIVWVNGQRGFQSWLKCDGISTTIERLFCKGNFSGQLMKKICIQKLNFKER
jgi:hypothetical protein